MPIDYRNTLNSLTIDDLANWTQMGGGDVQSWLDAVNAGGYGVSERQAIEDFAAGYVNFYSNGDGTYTMTGFANQVQSSSTNAMNSNVGDISRGEVQTPINVSQNSTTGKIEMSTTPASGSLGQNAAYFLTNVGQAVCAANVGVMLGKTIDSALYNANPDYWDSIGMSSLNPETWNSITNGDDSLAAGLFNMILGLNPDTGKAQAYLDANAVAYMAYVLAQNDWFSNGETSTNISGLPSSIPMPFKSCFGTFGYITTGNTSSDVYRVCTANSGVAMAIASYEYSKILLVASSSSGARYNFDSQNSGPLPSTSFPNRVAGTFFKNGKTVYYATSNTSFNYAGATNIGYNPVRSSIDSYAGRIAWEIFYGDSHTEQSVPGTGSQSTATLPDTTSWTTPAATLTSLQQQYPQLFQDALVWDNVQPDGTNPQMVYIPVPMVETATVTDPVTDTQTYTVSQPLTNTDVSSQTNPQIDYTDTSGTGDSIIDLLVRLVQQNPETASDPETETATDLKPVTVITNPVDTGTGDTPSIPTPTGSASSLWSVYHPSQSEVDSFGAWLWSGNIITQIQQLLQNPMEGIITLHKIFATPVDAGTSTIVVGRLDSNVSSATVDEQYVTVDCGSVDLDEYFGNVFDYSPFTSVSIYLPFIGIVSLNVEDVMRSTVSVTYGVDVFTGACLAMVEVVRDSHTVVMYQYSGVASVEYPLTGSVHSGLINGILGIAGGIAGVAAAASGVGAVAGASAIAGGIANLNRSNNARSGSFSGNVGAMGIKKPYLIIERPQTKVAETFPTLDGFPTNYSIRLGDCSQHVVCKTVHVSGISATEKELQMIESILKSGVEV